MRLLFSLCRSSVMRSTAHTLRSLAHARALVLRGSPSLVECKPLFLTKSKEQQYASGPRGYSRRSLTRRKRSRTSQPLITSCPCHVCLLHHCTAPSWHVVSERSSTCCLLVRCLHCHSARWVTDEVMMIIYVLLYSLSSVFVRNRYCLYYSSGDSILPLLKKRM